MFASRAVLAALFVTLTSLPAQAAPADDKGTLAQTLNRSSVMEFITYDSNFAGARRDNCCSGGG